MYRGHVPFRTPPGREYFSEGKPEHANFHNAQNKGASQCSGYGPGYPSFEKYRAEILFGVGEASTTMTTMMAMWLKKAAPFSPERPKTAWRQIVCPNKSPFCAVHRDHTGLNLGARSRLYPRLGKEKPIEIASRFAIRLLDFRQQHMQV